MTRSIPWNDETRWCLTATEADLPDFHPYHIGNGRIGVRVGPMVLDWNGDTKPLLCENGPDFWGRLNARILYTLAKHVYDAGNQMILPAWNQVRLEIAGVEYDEGNGCHRLRNTLDLRSGEAVCEDVWEYQPGRTVTIRLRLVVPRCPRPCAAWFELSLAGLSVLTVNEDDLRAYNKPSAGTVDAMIIDTSASKGSSNNKNNNHLLIISGQSLQ